MTRTTPKTRCIFCGKLRPPTEQMCPTCGSPWIDEYVVPPAQPVTTQAQAPPPSAADDLSVPPPYPSIEHDAPASPAAPPTGRPTWLVPVSGVAALIALVAIAAFVVGDRSDTTAAPTSAPTATTVAPPLSTQPSTTTVPPTTTTPATTSSSSTTTTTTTTTTTLPPIEAIGDPIPLDALTLGAFALGPFEFEVVNDDLLGRLAATFGQPDAIEPAGTDLGMCEGDEAKAVRWGPLSVLMLATPEGEALVGYRLAPDAATADHPAAALRTLSGVGVGVTVAELRAVYAASTIDIESFDGTPHFVLRRSTDAATLLWGPLSAPTEDATVTAIYSRRPCDKGPLPAGS